jgi:hypothetical protein
MENPYKSPASPQVQGPPRSATLIGVFRPYRIIAVSGFVALLAMSVYISRMTDDAFSISLVRLYHAYVWTVIAVLASAPAFIVRAVYLLVIGKLHDAAIDALLAAVALVAFFCSLMICPPVQ